MTLLYMILVIVAFLAYLYENKQELDHTYSTGLLSAYLVVAFLDILINVLIYLKIL